MWMWMQGIVLSMLYHGGEKQETKKANTSPRRCGRAQIRSYMQMYAFALSTSSSVVSRTLVSLMYAHRRFGGLSEDWLVRASSGGEVGAVSDGGVPRVGVGADGTGVGSAV